MRSCVNYVVDNFILGAVAGSMADEPAAWYLTSALLSIGCALRTLAFAVGDLQCEYRPHRQTKGRGNRVKKVSLVRIVAWEMKAVFQTTIDWFGRRRLRFPGWPVSWILKKDTLLHNVEGGGKAWGVVLKRTALSNWVLQAKAGWEQKIMVYLSKHGRNGRKKKGGGMQLLGNAQVLRGLGGEEQDRQI